MGVVVIDGLFGVFFHTFWGVEVRFANTQADNVFALFFQFAGNLGHR